MATRLASMVMYSCAKHAIVMEMSIRMLLAIVIEQLGNVWSASTIRPDRIVISVCQVCSFYCKVLVVRDCRRKKRISRYVCTLAYKYSCKWVQHLITNGVSHDLSIEIFFIDKNMKLFGEISSWALATSTFGILIVFCIQTCCSNALNGRKETNFFRFVPLEKQPHNFLQDILAIRWPCRTVTVKRALVIHLVPNKPTKAFRFVSNFPVRFFASPIVKYAHWSTVHLRTQVIVVASRM